MIDVIVSGAAGRLGGRIVDRVLAAKDLNLCGAIVRAGAKLEGQRIDVMTARATSAICFSSDLGAVLGQGAVLIETVTDKKVALAHATVAADAGAAILMATTGLAAADRSALEALGEKVAILLAPNLSAGVAVLTELVRQASRALPDFDLEIVEAHHRNKKDAPSGTAWALARAAGEARGQDAERDAVLARAGDVGARGKKEIGIQSLRGGEVVGEHTVFLFGDAERIELTHRASSRDVFADGAVRAAAFLGASGRGSGVYSMRDVLGLA